jgi:hypothetical protein
LFPIGATMLRQRGAWSLAVATEVAETLGVELKLEIVSDASAE